MRSPKGTRVVPGLSLTGHGFVWFSHVGSLKYDFWGPVYLSPKPLALESYCCGIILITAVKHDSLCLLKLPRSIHQRLFCTYVHVCVVHIHVCF